MNDSELIKSELCFQGLYCDGNECISTRSGQVTRRSVQDEMGELRSAIRENKSLLREIWVEMVKYLSARPHSFVEGGEVSQRIFANAVRMLYRTSKRFASLNSGKQLLYSILCQDVVAIGDAFMSRVVDFSMAIDWLHHLVRNDMYRLTLLTAYAKNTSVKTADGNYGIFPLEMRERVWSYKEDEEDRDDAKNNPVYDFWHRRNEVSEKYNDPYSFDEGFVWREMRNDPYDFDDEEENPYPHRDLLWKP